MDRRGYQSYGGIVRRGRDVDRHYITPAGLNMLLYIPDGDDGRMHYLSMHVELFNRHTASLFPRARIFLRSSMAAAAAEHKQREKAALPGKREDGLPAPPSVQAAKYLLSVAKNALPEGRLGLEEEVGMLAFVGAYLPDLAADPAAIRDFIAAVALLEDSLRQYRALGLADPVAGEADHGFSAFAQVAASLLRVGEYQEAVTFFERARNAAGVSLARDDPFGYASFTGDYSDALAAAGETRKARRYWDEA